MAIEFKVKDVIHNIIAKFVHTFLPEASPRITRINAEFLSHAFL